MASPRTRKVLKEVRAQDENNVATVAEGKEWSIETSPARNWTPPQPKTSLSSTHRCVFLLPNVDIESAGSNPDV
ncbi:hypothetical protein llap_20593 [Limosa lapponica baueri]|uniref:Uncharacterized protein n=1 Tax=Limosa lapponica baueri TaxID=1758121 RepID=A0A2I0T5M7_LIMLA|nr:hypothetical protein llap_20593 [Limosa lapponica baueri]